MKETGIGMMLLAVGGIMIMVLISIPLSLWPRYNVWSREMNGKAELAEATWNRQIKIEEAKANLESQELNAQAEVARAKGLAEAQQIVSSTLNEQYLRYLWINNVEAGENRQVIYVPTEAGLPILEAGKRE
jgi:regulator of protease activity HflC (stomatin/prohibitin superfamily)